MLSSRGLQLQGLLFAGLGVIAGYGIFFVLWRTQCASLVQEIELRHNVSLQQLSLQHKSLEDSHHECMREKDGDHRQALDWIQEMLQKQTDLVTRYHDLLTTHEETLLTLKQVQSEKEASCQTVHSLNEQIKRLQRELGLSTLQLQQTKQQAKREKELLQTKLQVSQAIVHQKIEEVKQLLSDGVGKCDTDKETEK